MSFTGERWPALMTIDQAGEYLGFGKTFVNSLRASGELSSVRIRSQIRFRRSDLDKFIEGLPEGQGNFGNKTVDSPEAYKVQGAK